MDFRTRSHLQRSLTLEYSMRLNKNRKRQAQRLAALSKHFGFEIAAKDEQTYRLIKANRFNFINLPLVVGS